jgi:hypothetical protein
MHEHDATGPHPTKVAASAAADAAGYPAWSLTQMADGWYAQRVEPDVKAAARILGRRGGQSKSPAKVAAVRANGARGGRPTTLALVDDLGRVVGITSAAPGRVGEAVEYGSRLAARTRPDGIVEAPSFAVEGRARLARLPKGERGEDLRRWDIQ